MFAIFYFKVARKEKQRHFCAIKLGEETFNNTMVAFVISNGQYPKTPGGVMINIQHSLAYNKNIRIKTRTGKLGAQIHFTV